MSRRHLILSLGSALVLGVLASNGCLIWQVAGAHKGKPGPANMDRFASLCVPLTAGHEPIQLYVYPDRPQNAGPPLLLLHELPGMTPECVEFARRLGDDHFTVYLPLLFGTTGTRLKAPHSLSPCTGPDFVCVANRPSPMAALLSPLVDYIAARERNSSSMQDVRIAVIGMCLTGNFPLTLLHHQDIKAAVLSQPALPLSLLPGRATLFGLTEEQVAAVKQSKTPILAFRFQTDHISPAARFRSLKNAFGQQIELYPVPSDHPSHSVFTDDFEGNRPATSAAYARLVEFLRLHLQASQNGAHPASGTAR
jgi:dienelactone hydrolase